MGVAVMMLADDVASVLPEMQAHAESLMTSTCEISRLDSSPVFDPETGLESPGPPSIIYAGPCRVQDTASTPVEADAAGSPVTAGKLLVHVPISCPPIRPGDLIEVHAVGAPLDGILVRVVADHVKTLQTARRLPCEVVT